MAYVATPEIRLKLRLSHLGQRLWKLGISPSAETRRKISKSQRGTVAWCKGLHLLPRSDEHKAKISSSLRGRMPKFIPSDQGIRHTEQSRLKMRLAHLGKPQSPEHRGHMIKGKTGIKTSYEHRRRMSLARLKSKNHFWKKGRTF